MKQIIQNLKTGATLLEDIPVPVPGKGQILIKTSRSLVSLGTEKMLVEFGRANLISKARQQPERVKMVLDKIKSDGLLPTLEAVFNKLDQPLPLGYCNAGVITAVGEGVRDFKIGDRVVSNGAHAEFVCVPQNLAAHIPDNVSDDEAAFTVIGSIGLQGIRLLNPTFGETIVVIGLGLIGLITAQLLKANGCRVIGIDLDSSKLTLAASLGIETINPGAGNDPVKVIEDLTSSTGADGVIITASAKTDEIISQAARMCRKRGRIILVGVIGLQLNRAEFYEKELTFQVSCSYGPGRYDESYEQKGIDYPIGFVRWTEQRNFQAILASISRGSLQVKELITETVLLEDYMKIYGEMGASGSIASLIQYPQKSSEDNFVKINTTSFKEGKGIAGIIGSGNFTKMTMLPALKKTAASIKYIASASGVSGTALAKKYGISVSTTDYKNILKDSEVDLVMITTRHGLHASMTIEALEAGKNVFVEKPLALTREELQRIQEVYIRSGRTITVGFNRRFSPYAVKMKSLLGNNPSPMNFIATMNAGFIPSNVWVHDMQSGGGRIIGEACHFIDLISYLSSSEVSEVCMNALGTNPAENTDNASILLKYENGTNAVINYFSNGHKSYSKERLEVYSEGRTLIMDNFRTMKGYGFKGFSSMSGRQDKGHKNQFEILVQKIKSGGDAPIDFSSLYNTTLASIAAVESMKTGAWVKIKN